MPRYIKLEDVEEMLSKAHIISDSEYEYCGYCTDDININEIPIADVVPRSELEQLESELEQLESEVEQLENELAKCYIELDKSTDFYCSFTKSKLQECPIQDEVEKAKQEVAGEIFEEIEELLALLDKRYMLNLNPKQAWGVRGAMAEIAKLKNKYIGEKK